MNPPLARRLTVQPPCRALHCKRRDSSTTEYLHAPDATFGQVHNLSFSFVVWVWLDSKPADGACIFSKENTTGNQYAYRLYYGGSQDRFRFAGTANGAAESVVMDSNLGSPSVRTWYMLTCGFRSTANLIISTNDNAFQSASLSSVASSTWPFAVGVENAYAEFPFDGRIDSLGLYLNKEFSNAERTALYNGGRGCSFGDLGSIASGTLASPTAWFDFEDRDGNGALWLDSSGNRNHLLAGASAPTSIEGKR